MAYPYQSYQAPYQNFYPFPQTMQTNQQVQNYSPVINQSGIVWISGEQEAAMYPIAPNNAVALWDQSGKAVYLKQADASGKPTMRVYDLVERVQTAQSADGKTIEYATKNDLSAILSAYDAIKADIETIRGDLYGIAGKKKSVKKTEDDDE